MSAVRIIVLTTLAMLAFAGNSLLCRLALQDTAMDAASFTSIRLISGAMVLWLIVALRRNMPAGKGNWPPWAVCCCWANPLRPGYCWRRLLF